MTFYQYCLHSPVVQFYWVLKHGTYLAQRWEADDEGINLCCTGDGRGFFVEVGAGYSQEQPVVLRSFVNNVPKKTHLGCLFGCKK